MWLQILQINSTNLPSICVVIVRAERSALGERWAHIQSSGCIDNIRFQGSHDVFFHFNGTYECNKVKYTGVGIWDIAWTAAVLPFNLLQGKTPFWAPNLIIKYGAKNVTSTNIKTGLEPISSKQWTLFLITIVKLSLLQFLIGS